MSLNQLLFLPENDRDLKAWFFYHQAEHLRIRTAIQQQGHLNLPIYVLDPVDMQHIDRWLNDHQSAHNDFNAALGLASNDLTSVNFSDRLQRNAWAFYNYEEHLAACQALKI